jgi:hypothetical protein
MRSYRLRLSDWIILFSQEPPDPQQWSDFYTFFLFTMSVWEPDKTDAGKLARQIVREIDNLWVFLNHQGVEPTNNRAERALRFEVLWRKRSLGTQSEKGNRWVERILSFKETCRLKAKATFPALVDCIKSYFQNSPPDLSWIQFKKSLPCERVPSSSSAFRSFPGGRTCFFSRRNRRAFPGPPPVVMGLIRN